MGYNTDGHFDDLDHKVTVTWQKNKLIQLWMISTNKQAIKIKFAATVGHNKFLYFSLKLSVPVILKYGHMSVSYKTYVQSGQSVTQCLLSEPFGVERKGVILLFTSYILLYLTELDSKASLYYRQKRYRWKEQTTQGR